jgi:integrase/recombinase XerD
MIMETDAGPGCVQPDVALLAEFRGWLDRERGLSPVSVRCYSKQSKAFLAGIGGAGAVSGLDAGKVPRSWWAGRRAAIGGRRRRW